MIVILHHVSPSRAESRHELTTAAFIEAIMYTLSYRLYAIKAFQSGCHLLLIFYYSPLVLVELFLTEPIEVSRLNFSWKFTIRLLMVFLPTSVFTLSMRSMMLLK